MSEQDAGFDIVDDHPRFGEVERIWNTLNRLRPEEALADGPAMIVANEFPLPICLFDDIAVPDGFLEGRSADQIAFGLAYAACLSPGRHLLEDGLSIIDGRFGLSDDDESLLAIPLAAVAGVAGGMRGVWRALTRFASREREAIETSVEWLHEAGYDPNVGVSLFMSLAGWFDEHKSPRTKATFGDRVAGAASALLMAPLIGAMSVKIKDDPPMVAAADRAATVRAACVKLDVHR